MVLFSYLHLIFLSLVVFSSISLIFSKNPIYSVLFLILAFFGSASSLILFGVDFIGFLFIIIYVGAIAVLFLFVVMMLDLKLEGFSLNFYDFDSIFTIFVLCPILFGLIYNSSFIFIFNSGFESLSSFSFLLDSFSNIDIFGQCMYNYFISCFLIAGLILLVAMLGAIVLTLKYKSYRKNQFVSSQLSRRGDFFSYFE